VRKGFPKTIPILLTVLQILQRLTHAHLSWLHSSQSVWKPLSLTICLIVKEGLRSHLPV
jgi:hypothetical protein